MARTPLLALTLGDPAGIGLEVCSKALGEDEVRAAARFVVIGPEAKRCPAFPLVTEVRDEDVPEGGAVWVASEAPASWTMGEVQESCGRAALSALRIGHELALAGKVGGLVTAPVCKEALHLAGEEVEGQTELLGRWCGVDDHQMLAIAGGLRVLLLSRHLPLKEALELVTEERVVRHLVLLDRGLRELGIPDPEVALAGLNPHAGEGGLLGSEEREVLEPAVRRARELGVSVTGPVSPDAVFAAAANGAHDGVLALYHDQAFIPIKLLGEGQGLTVILGLPYLRVSPAHGTAFDIAGRGVARHEDLANACLEAARMAALRRG